MRKLATLAGFVLLVALGVFVAMYPVGIGWRLILLALLTIVAAAVGLVETHGTSSPAKRRLRRIAGSGAAIAGMAIIVILLVGPGEWRGPGSAYEVWGCA